MKAPKEIGKLVAFEIGYEKPPDEERDLTVYLFDPEGKLLGSCE